MAGKKSLPDVSQKVIANAEQYINEFKRAARAQKSETAAMDKELDRLQKSVGRKFGAADFGKELLRGFGIGSGFQLATITIEKWVDLFQDQEKAAKAAAESIAELNKQYSELAKQTFDLSIRGKGPGVQLEARKGELKNTQKDIQDISATIAKLNADMAQLSTGQGTTNLPATYGYFTSTKGMGDKVSKLLDEQTKSLAEKYTELNKIKGQIVDLEADLTKSVDAAVKDWFEPLDTKQKELDKAALERSKQSDFSGGGSMGLVSLSTEIEAAKVNAQLQDMLDNGKSLVDMAHDIQAARPFLFDPKEIDKSITGFRMMEVEAKKMKEVNDALTLFFDPLDKQQEELDRLADLDKKANEVSRSVERSINRAADSITDTWVDALNGVEGAWGDLGQVVAREIEAMIVKLLIVTPLMHALGGMFGDFGWRTLAAGFSGYGKPAADGGYRDGSQPYLVGEDGPEVFNPGRAGTITPNHMLGTGGRGGNIYNIDARGADQGAVERLEAALFALAGPGVVERRAMSASNDNRRRGGS